MKTLDEMLRSKLASAKKSYQNEIERIKKNIVKEFLSATLAERIKKVMPETQVNYYPDSIYVYLSGKYNITKDWMIFLDNNIEYIETLGKTREYKVTHEQTQGRFTYVFGDYCIYVDYTSGNCKRVKIGEKTKTIKEDIYEVECL